MGSKGLLTGPFFLDSLDMSTSICLLTLGDEGDVRVSFQRAGGGSTQLTERLAQLDEG